MDRAYQILVPSGIVFDTGLDDGERSSESSLLILGLEPQQACLAIEKAQNERIKVLLYAKFDFARVKRVGGQGKINALLVQYIPITFNETARELIVDPAQLIQVQRFLDFAARVFAYVELARICIQDVEAFKNVV